MSCIDEIIGIKAECDGADTESLSGYFITDYPGITIQSASNYNDEKTVTGFKYLQDLRRRAMLRLNNDIQAYIASTYRVNAIESNLWRTGEWDGTTIASGTSGQRRGIVIYKQKPQCRMYKIVIKSVKIYSNENIDTTLRLADTNGTVYSKPITLLSGVVNEFIINKQFEGVEVQVTLPSDIAVYGNKPNCGTGCGGTKANECLRVAGLNNGVANTTQSYGIELDTICKCDLSTLVCDLATNNLIGQSAYELCGAMFYDEMIKNHRMNYLTIYQGEEIKAQAQAGYEAYRGYLQNALSGLKRYLANNDGGCNCVDCSGIQVKSNV